MKKIAILMALCVMTFSSIAERKTSSCADVETACCNSYIVDAETGEAWVAVTVCRGDQSIESYILACVEANAIRDKILAP